MSGIDDLEQRQEEPLGRLAERAVLLRRPADDDRLVDRVAAHRHAVDRQRRERLDRACRSRCGRRTGPRAAAAPAPASPRARPAACAGTCSGTVLQSTISTRLRRRKPAKRYSSMSAGSGAVARVRDGRVGSRRRSRPAAARRAARPPRGGRWSPCGSASACRWCACRAAAAGTCPRLRTPVSGCLVWVRPRLKKTPPSSGQACSPGSMVEVDVVALEHDVLARARSSPSSAARASAAPSLPNASRSPTKPCGSSGLSSPPIRSPISSSVSTPSALSIRRSVPKTFMASGMPAAGRPLEQQRRPAAPGPPAGRSRRPPGSGRPRRSPGAARRPSPAGSGSPADRRTPPRQYRRGPPYAPAEG